MAHVVFSYVAVKPMRAEHPVGSGVIVEYEPGDMIPASDWGRAADNLVELGKAARLAVNVADDEDEVLEEAVVSAIVSSEPSLEWPAAGAAGWYTLSDGSRVRGKKAAEAAQAELE